MSEDNTDTTETATSDTTLPAKESAAVSMLAVVAERIKGSGDEVQKRFIDALVEREVSSRVELLDKAVQKRFTLMADLKKIDRADEVKKDATGKTIFESWSDTRRDEIKKGKEALAKHEKAIEAALVNGDWSKLKS